MPNVPTADLEERAIHEAGHVVALLSFPNIDHKVLFVTIADGRKAAGEVFRKGTELPRPERAVVYMAGIAAQVTDFLHRRPGSDKFMAYLECMVRGGDDIEALERRNGIRDSAILPLLDACMAHLAPLWPRVELIARELVSSEHRTLYHQEAEWLFAGDVARVAWYRRQRQPATPHPDWIEGVADGGKPGAWFERKHSLEFHVDKARSLLDRWILPGR
jgi:hypothetical protein